MRIFMLCNVAPPIVSETDGTKASSFGGWMDGISRFLIRDNELTICYRSDRNIYTTLNDNLFVGFIESHASEVISKVLDEKDYDIYHIWGTEYEHSYICVSILQQKGLLEKCIVSIQGLVSIIAKHYTEGIPREYLYRKTLREFIRGNDIVVGCNYYSECGRKESELLKTVHHVIGRTNWDKACIQAVNGCVNYHVCNESLRECFYDDTHWDFERCNKHSIFVSQCSYPVKGFHYLLEAMPIILKKYPDAQIVTTGEDFINIRGWRKKDQGAYRRYLIDLISRYDLHDHVSFKGLLDAEQMKEEYLRANVFVCCSVIENSPNSVGEAMILGCPVVSSYVGGTMDMITHDNEGYLYQSSSIEMLAYYVCKVFEDRDKTIQLSQSAVKRAHLTHDRKKNNYTMLDIYKLISGYEEYALVR